MAIKFLNTATAATQAVGDNSTKIATTAYADAAAAAIPIGDYVTLATAQTISGAKTFNNDVTLNNTYLLGVDKLEANQIVIGTSTSSILGNVGIGTTSPTTSYSKVLQIHASGNGSTLRLTDSVSGSLIGSGLELLQYGIDSYIINRESGPMYFMTSSTTKMTILANGSVGINTTSPNQKLHVNGATQLGDINATASFGTVALKVVEGSISTGPTLGSGTVGAQAVLYSNGLFGMYTGVSPATGDTWMQSQRNDASTSAYNILLNPAGGNVGIGGGTPFGKLDVAGNIRLQSANQIYFGGTGSIPYWSVGVDNTTNNNFVIGGSSYYSGDRDILLNPVNNGNVGIGTDSPSANLEVSKVGTTEVRVTGLPNSGSSYGGTSNLWLRTSTYGNSLIAFGPSSTTAAANAAAGISYNDYASTMTIKTNYSDRITINSSGAVRILGSGSVAALEFGSYGGKITSNYNTLETNYNLKVNGAVIVKDLNTTAGSSYAGALRYRVSGTNSYVDMCMQTGASTYTWVNIVQNNW